MLNKQREHSYYPFCLEWIYFLLCKVRSQKLRFLFQMYQNVLIVGCFLISASQSFPPNKDLSEPKTFKLIQNIVRHNYERSLKRQHQSLVGRNYPPMDHPRIPMKTPIRRTRHLKPSKRTQRKINNYQRKAQQGPSIPYSGEKIDRTFTVHKSTKNPPSSKEVRPTFLIKPAGNKSLTRIVNLVTSQQYMEMS